MDNLDQRVQCLLMSEADACATAFRNKQVGAVPKYSLNTFSLQQETFAGIFWHGVT
jgi:hypothetical protein